MARKILVRFDDICSTMDFSQWNRAIEVLKKFNVKPLLGVIPCCQDKDLKLDEERQDFWEYLKSLQNEGYTLAMHGYKHICDKNSKGIVNQRYGSEFAGYTYDEQLANIKEGKRILEEHGIYTDIFFAPRHSYDRNTLKALAASGFKYISDGKSKKPLFREGIICIPCRSSGCPKIRKNGYYTAVFHAHEWTRPDKADGYLSLRNLCEQYHDDIVDFDEYAKRDIGIYWIELLSEKLFMVWDFKIRPFLSKIKHEILMRK